MADLGRYRWAACAAVAAVSAAWALGGCGTEPHPRPAGASSPVSARRAAGPAGGSTALARAVGRRLLAALPLPAGTRRTGPHRIPERAESIGTPNLADLSRFYVVPLRRAAAYRFFASHRPAGTKKTGWGTESGGGSGETFVSDSPAAPPAGIDPESELLVTMAAGPHGSTLVRADAEIVWYPPRTAAEYIWPASYRAVAIRARFTRPAARGARTFTSQAIIARLARLFDHMRTVTPGAIYGCPPVAPGEFTITFRPARPGQPALTVTPGFCTADMVTVGGRHQPALSDFDSTKALTLLRALLRPAGATGPPSQTRAAATRIAGRVLAHLVLPAHATRLPQRPVPPGLRRPADHSPAVDSVDRYRLYHLPLSVPAAVGFLAAHPPPGMTADGTGSGTDGRDVTFAPRHTPAGIEGIELDYSVVPGPRSGALLRADAEVIWYPARSAAEHLDPADYRTVRITATVYGTSVRTVARTFTSAAAIGRLIRALDALPASPGILYHGPAMLVTYRLAFGPAKGPPAAVVDADNCPPDTITVAGQPQPALQDFGTVAALAGRLMHLGFPRRTPKATRGVHHTDDRAR